MNVDLQITWNDNLVDVTQGEKKRWESTRVAEPLQISPPGS